MGQDAIGTQLRPRRGAAPKRNPITHNAQMGRANLGPSLSFPRNQEAEGDNRLQIDVVGGGPAGLWFAFLLKGRRPAWSIRVHEQNPATATYGFGVVLSDAGRDRVRSAAPAAFDRIAQRMERWPDLTIVHRDERVPIDGNGFSSIGRLELLQTLHELCRKAGVALRFDAAIASADSIAELRAGADLVVGADGINSRVRAALESEFRPRTEVLGNRYAWYGTRQVFPTLTLTFRPNADGAFVAHHYRYAPDMSTFIVECDAATWERSGLEHLDDEASRRYCETIFTPDLGGHPLVSNRSAWLRFPVLACEHWRHEDVVLIGDALRSVHFSIGSGTRLAMEDADALAAALDESGGRIAEGLACFEAARRPVVDKLLAGAAGSWSWYERFADRMHLSAHEFAYDYMTRSGRLSDERLRAIAPRFARRLAAARAEAASGPGR